jgi:hypothetical protein
LKYQVREGDKHDWWFARFPVGDLLHISTFKNREQNIKALITRAEEFTRACLPLIARSTNALFLCSWGVRTGEANGRDNYRPLASSHNGLSATGP